MPKPKTLTPAEVQHITAALQDYRDVVEAEPAIITNKQEDRLLVAEEIMNENSGS